MKYVPHKHAEVIKAWADGYPIQVRSVDGQWMDMTPIRDGHEAPAWMHHLEYRVKPEPARILMYQPKGVTQWFIAGMDEARFKTLYPLTRTAWFKQEIE